MRTVMPQETTRINLEVPLTFKNRLLALQECRSDASMLQTVKTAVKLLELVEGFKAEGGEILIREAGQTTLQKLHIL